MLRQLMCRTRRDELTTLEAEIAADRLKIPDPQKTPARRSVDTALRDKSTAIAAAFIVGTCAAWGGGLWAGTWSSDYRDDAKIRAALEEARAESQAYTVAYNTARDQ